MTRILIAKTGHKIIALLSVLLFLSNIFFIHVFAGNKLDLNLFTIKKGDANAQNGNVEANPGDILHLLLSGKNAGDNLTNVKADFSFSSNNFTYLPQTNLHSYKNWIIENSTIDTSIFNPPFLNTAPIASQAPTGTYLDLYYVDIQINNNTSDTLLTLGGQLKSDLASSLTLSRTIYINSRPHIVGYSFEKAGVTTSSLQRGGDQVDLVIKIKDYNACENIDSATVTANLSKIGLGSNESLSFVSCNQNIAIYKKSNITTLLQPQTVTFLNTDFSVTDENGLSNLVNDPNTTFDDEDKKDPLSFEIASAGNPTVFTSSLKNYVGTGVLNNFAMISFTGSQNGDTKITVGGDATCNGTIIQDWKPGYLANTGTSVVVSTSILNEGVNTIYTCLKNDEGKVGSANVNITKDITAPILSGVSFGPVDVVNNNSGVKFICNENGTYQIEKTNPGLSNTVILTGSIIANANNSISIPNSSLSIGTNDVYIYCLDQALNFTYKNATISKTTPPPSLNGKITSFADNDIDYDGVNGKDISLTWDNTVSASYQYFESYRLYLLPSNINLDKTTHQYIKLLTSKFLSSFTGDESIKNDSLGNPIVSGGSYKTCVSIMGTNGVLGDEGCSGNAILSGDNVSHPKILSAKFTTNTNLEITTDATLDTNMGSHSGSLFNFTYNGNSSQPIAITSISGDKINLQISPLNNISATGVNVIASTGAIRANAGGFNNTTSILNITDGQTPTISNFLKMSSSLYNNFYSGSIDFSYTFGENMKLSFTKLQFIREGGNPDSNVYNFALTGSKLNMGNNTTTIDLKTLGLRDGTYYKTHIVGQDIAGNNVESNYIGDIRFDAKGPSEVTKNETLLYNTTSPLLSWNNAIDNNGNGSGINSYNLVIYNGKTCQGASIQEQNVLGTTKTLTSLGDVADYSWKIFGVDRMGNIGDSNTCSFFRIDTRKPSFSNLQIQDTALLSTTYLKKGNTIEVSANITNTDIAHIWADLSLLTGNNTDTHISCATPVQGTSCTYTGDKVLYSLPAGNINDGVKQISLTAQNLSGGNDTVITQNSTADSTAPSIANDAFIKPTGTIGGTGALITWNTNKITDTIGLKTLKIEYGIGGVWTTLGTSPNNGSFLWNLTNITSGSGYTLKITASDNAGNEASLVSPAFTIDRTNPIIMASTLFFPNGNDMITGGKNITIQWAPGLISDAALKTNPIALYYSLDNGATYKLIDENLSNSGTYVWKTPIANNNQVKIKLSASDTVGNFGIDTSDSTFTIDSQQPSLTFSYPSTPPNGSFMNNSGINIMGITEDAYLKTVSYSFEDTTSHTFYNGSSFTGTQTWVNICNDPVDNGTNDTCKNITLALNPNIINTDAYSLLLKSNDEAGNETISVPLKYIGDTQNPNLVVSTLSGAFFQNSITLSGISDDSGAGIASVKIQIKKGNTYWDGNSFVTGAQYLNTITTDTYKHWSYDFNPTGGDDSFEVKIFAYDAVYSVNNETIRTITIHKDTVKPNIIGGLNLFTSPLINSIHIGGNVIPITWNALSITDTGAGLGNNSIKLEYFDGTQWKLIADNEANDGSYTWTSPLLDEKNVKIRLTATDTVGNFETQLSNPFIIDSTPPSIQKIETMDMDADGKIDALNVTMSEPIQDASIQLANFSIGTSIGVPTGWETGLGSDDENFILKFNNTGDTSTTPTLSYTKGSLIDTAGKFLETISGKRSIDKAVPRVLGIEAIDTNTNGKLDTLNLTLSEKLSPATDITPFSLLNTGNGISVASLLVAGNILHLGLNEGTNYDTSVGSMAVNIQQNQNLKDLDGNMLASVTNMSPIDKANPVLVNAEYFDADGNYKVDTIKLTFSENITGFNSSDFSLSGLTKKNASMSGQTISLNTIETTNDNDTGIIASVSFVAGNLKDSMNNFVSNIVNKSITDKVVPKLLSIETKDSNGNGKIDTLVLSYSEPLNNNFNGFIGEVEGYTIASYTKASDSVLNININENTNADSGIAPFVSIPSNTTFQDNAGNNIKTFIHQASLDKVGPVIIGAKYNQTTHKISFAYSEGINVSDLIPANIILNNAGSYTITAIDTVNNTITLSGENIVYGTTNITFANNKVRDNFGNMQNTPVFVKISPPVVINEVMLSTNLANNYIELRNLSDNIINIGGFKVAGITIPTGTNISASGYYLISKTSQVSSIINVTPNLVDSNLNITGTSVTLNNGVMNIDSAPLTNYIGDINTPKAMERNEIVGDGASIANWHIAQVSTGFDISNYYGTPNTQNIHDITAPTLSTYFPADNTLLPTSGKSISLQYTDNIGGLGVDSLSDSIKLYKWDATNSQWGSDIAPTYLDIPGKIITSSSALYNYTKPLPYGKYKIDFSLKDNAKNTLQKSIIYYVDDIDMKMDYQVINIGTIYTGKSTFANEELTITVKTLGAGFKVNMNQQGNLSFSGYNIVDFNSSHGFGFNTYNGGYDGTLSPIGNGVQIASQGQNINTSGERNTYTYTLKYGAKVDEMQGAGFYTAKPRFTLLLDY